ncbi:uncharacterized protein LOC108678750 [Hyalella azteca]|uniref:Uncharacterized protein LOC108678750 n=1 Tax=Hyalella azteca TaxID=294128 RepID=A0A8B7P970_HYAAZ|nr:uncharacterized protein LOC108678750 [Hyalella azteca]
MDDNDPFEEDIVFDQAGLLGGKNTRNRHHYNATGFLPTFMLFSRTLFLCVAFIGLGLCGSISRGPVIKVQEWLGVKEWEALHTFTAHSIGALCGGLLGSKLFDRYNRQFLVFVSLVWVSVSVSILPFTIPVSLWWMRSTLVAISAGIAFLFTGGNVLCLDLWGRQGGGASLQALHFSYALGAFIAPVIIHPFFAGQHLPVLNNSVALATTTTTTTSTSTIMPFTLPSGGPATTSLHSTNNLLPFEPSSHAALQHTAQDLDVIPDARSDVYEDENLVRVPRTLVPIRRIREADLMTYSQNDLLKLTLPPVQNHSGVVQNSTFTTSQNLNSTSNSTDGTLSSSRSVDLAVATASTVAAPINNSTKPVRPKPSHTGASVKNEDTSQWKKPAPGAQSGDAPAAVSIAVTTEVSIASNESQILTKNESLLPGPIVNGSSSGTKPETGNFSAPNNTKFEALMALNDTANKSVSIDPVQSLESSTTPRTAVVIENQMHPKFLSTTPLPSRVDVTSPAAVDDSPYGAVDALYKLQMSSKLSPSDLQLNNAVSESMSSTAETDRKRVSISLSPSRLPDAVSVSNHLFEKPMNQQNVFSDEQMSISVQGPEVLDLKEPETEMSVSLPLETNDTKPLNDTESNGSKIIHSIVRLLKKPGTFSNITDDNKFIETIAQKFKRYGVTKIHLAFICIGVFVLINSMIFVVILCHNPREPRSKQEEGSLDRSSHSRYAFFMVLFSLFMFTAEALEGAIHHLLASNSEGSGLGILDKGIDGPALFWGLVCIVRFLCILFSGCLRLKPGKLLGISIFLETLGTIFLCVGSFGKEDFLWSGIILSALGLAPILPTSLLWMAQYMHVTHKMCAIMIILTSFGNSLTHGGLTHIAANSHLYSYILVIMSLASMLLLLVSWCLIYFNGGNSSTGGPGSTRRAAGSMTTDPSSDGYHLARQHEEEDEDIDLHDRLEMSRQGMRRASSLAGSFDDDYGAEKPALDRSQHRQLHHMHSLEHEEAGQSLLID